MSKLLAYFWMASEFCFVQPYAEVVVHVCADRGRLCRVGATSSHTRAEFKSEPVDIVILTNGPGEVATWVRPVVAQLRRTAEDGAIDMRISV
jgi:hypothetical protein